MAASASRRGIGRLLEKGLEPARRDGVGIQALQGPDLATRGTASSPRRDLDEARQEAREAGRRPAHAGLAPAPARHGTERSQVEPGGGAGGDGAGAAREGQLAVGPSRLVAASVLEGLFEPIAGEPPVDPADFPGVIDADPMLVDPLGADGVAGTEDDDLHLAPGSPAIDAGFNAVVIGAASAHDLDRGPLDGPPGHRPGRLRERCLDPGQPARPAALVALPRLQSGGRRSVSGIGHNVEGAEVRFEVRLFNSLSRPAEEGGDRRAIVLPAGSSIGDLLRSLGLHPPQIHLVLVNGRDITPSLHGGPRTDYVIQDGDVVALSGPVPYSWGYGSPVV